MEPKNLKGNLDVLIEKLRADGKVTEIPTEEWNEIMTGMEEGLAEYQAEAQIQMKRSEEELFHIVLNA